ncbi:WcaF family extracellular polysaccharide biosynthesis acetyltransferase [Pontibacter locisalis]|uniref:WcaF family extracellular polysaccharide biosynthesis acetyltransferase n=1 Tax=Pontibacter locisalis TaxID=1719035 RepID=A0ABW5IRR5_9BACT
MEIQQSEKRVQLDTYNNSWYKPGASIVKRSLWLIANALFFINPLNPSSALKISLLRLFGARIGRGVNIKPTVSIKCPWYLSIGNNVWIGEQVWIDNLTTVSIEDNVTISQGAMLLTGSHDYTRVGFDLKVGKIKVESGAWIGAKAIVCPGVSCGSHSVLAVSSVATKHLEPYTIYQGNPAEPKRQRRIE